MTEQIEEIKQPGAPVAPGGVSNFVTNLLKSKSKKATRKKLPDDKANLQTNSFDYNLFAPTVFSTEKRYLGQSDNLINPASFAGYWHQRNKKRPADQEEYIYVKAKDIDGDGLDDNVAYYVKNGKNHLVGLNQYYISEPKKSQQAYKKGYYEKDPKERENYSYSDYLRTAEYVKDFLTADELTEIQNNKKAKLDYKVVLKFAEQSETFKKLSPSEKEAVAMTFLKIMTDAMFVDKCPTYYINQVKKWSKFTTVKKEALDFILTKCTEENQNAEKIVKNLYNGHSEKILTWARGLFKWNQKQFTLVDVKAIEKAILGRKAIRSGDANARDEDIDTYRLKQRYDLAYGDELDLA